jgi:hypothetical protein
MFRTVRCVSTVALALGLLAGCELAAAQLLAQFEFALHPQELTVSAGSSADVQVVVTPVAGISITAVTVRLVAPPAGITAEPLMVMTQGDWTIEVAASVTAATHQLEVEAVSQGLNLLPVTRTRTLTLQVTASVP